MMKNNIKIILIMFLVLLIFIFVGGLNTVRANNTKKQTIEEGVYIIKSALNENCVFDIYNNSKENGANLGLWTNNSQDNQKFNVKYLENGYYTIWALHSNRCIDVENDSKELGANVLQWESNNQDNQQWIIKDVGNGYYNIISKSNGLYLDIPYSNAQNGSNVQMWFGNNGRNQMFKFERQQDSNQENESGKPNTDIIKPTKTIEDGLYVIKLALDEQCVFDIYNNSKDNGARLELWTNNNQDNQKFNVRYLGNGYYTISALHSNKCIDVENNSKELSANVLQWESNNQDNQQWIIKDAGNGYYNIISKSNGLYLDIPNSKVQNGVNIKMWFGNDGKNQMFKFKKITNIIEPVKTIENGVYTIKTSAYSDGVLDVSASSINNGGNVVSWKNNSTSNQKFTIRYLDDGYYTLSAVHSGKYLDVEGAVKDNGANVIQWEGNNQDNQKWIIKAIGNGEYNIISKYSGLYLSVVSGNVCVSEANNSNNQKFKFDTSNLVPYIDTSKYPGYKEKIESLMSKHPNWNFELLYTGLKFDEVVAGEYSVHSRNLVPTDYTGEWVCSVCGTRLYDSGWYCTSEKAIAYYMDPRNFLDETNVFQFQNVNMYIDGVCSLEGIKNQVNNTYLQNYATEIENACKNKNVNAYYIISRLIQEQGRAGTTIGKGMASSDGKTYYNPFNIGASGNGYDQIYANALATAKKYNWDTMQKAIEGGIDFCKTNWLDNYQNTLYQNKFDIDTRNGTSLYTHQYMQNLMGAYSEARLMKGMYESTNTTNLYFNFIIPVYDNMSSTISQIPQNSSEIYPMNVKITTSGINIREEASTESNVIKTIMDTDTVILSIQRGINSNWHKVILTDGTIGYMSGNYLEQISDVKNCSYNAKVKTNDGSGCYIRVGPSTRLDKITALSDGTTVRVIDEGRYNNIDGYDWCRVELLDGRQAFMPIRFLTRI